MKEFQNITKKQIEQNGVQALSDRPNSVGAYGSGGLSPLELKLAFDRLATLIAEKINEIHKGLAGDEAGQYIAVQLREQGIEDLAALVAAIESGRLAEIMQLTPSAGAEEKKSLQDIILSLARSLAEAKEDLGIIDDIKEALEEIEEIKAAIDNIPQFSEKDPTVPAWAKKENPPTPADLGAAPADIYIEAEPSTTGWYKVGTLGVKMSSANISIAFGGAFNVVRPNAHEINIIRMSSTNYIYNRTANQPNHCIGRIATKGVGVYAYYGNSSGKGNKIYASVHVTNGSFTSAGFIPADVTDGDMDCICYLNEREKPPMELGVEYRTTERYLGQPVYTRVMDFGALPNASKKSVDVFAENCTFVSFDVALYSTSSSGNRIVIPRVSASHYFNETLGTFTIETTDDSSKYNARITMKYTKPNSQVEPTTPANVLLDKYGAALTDADGDYLIPADAGEGNYQLSFHAEEIDERLIRAGNSILFTEQALTEEQKAQARANIGVILEEDEVTTKDVEYTFDGDHESDAHTWVSNSYAKLFVKVADLPDGEINLSGGTIGVVMAENSFANYTITITDEMVDETIDMQGWDIKAKVSGFQQIFYQHSATGDNSPVSMVAVCTKAGTYDVALNGWGETLHFAETGVYFASQLQYGAKKYVGSLSCTITYGSKKTEENPAEYDGCEIQVFTRGLCIGDSITEGVFNHSGGQVSIKKYAYPSVLERMTCIDIVNAGISGATSGTWYDATINSTPHWGRWLNNEWVWSESPDAGESDTVSTALDYSGFDFAIIHLGINDIFMMGDATIDETVSNFETNINNIINKLKTENTGIKVFLCTIIPSYAVPGNANYTAINEKIREIANATEDVFLIDLNEYSECKEGTPYSYIHLTAIGYQKMAAEIKTLISYTIKKNLSKFNMVQFIGTAYDIGT